MVFVLYEAFEKFVQQHLMVEHSLDQGVVHYRNASHNIYDRIRIKQCYE